MTQYVNLLKQKRAQTAHKRVFGTKKDPEHCCPRFVKLLILFIYLVAGVTGLEPAASGVTV